MRTRLLRSMAAHPWMTAATVLSVATPIAVALLPSTFLGQQKIDAVINELPIPGVIEFHEGDTSPISASPRRLSSDSGAPQRLDGVPSATPLVTANDAGARHAHFRDDQESPGRIENVGSNRPAALGPRGAWLTGTIEEPPNASAGSPRSARR